MKKHLDSQYELMVQRNKDHGDAVFKPVSVFSDAPAYERVKIMLDYKLTRYRAGHTDLSTENINDLIGYLLLWKMCRSGHF